MTKPIYILFFLIAFGNFSGKAQDDLKKIVVENDSLAPKINPLAPAKAAFFSAIVPGLGQAFNKKYWKIPLVYGALGTSLYAYFWNKQKYNEYRDAYKSRLLYGENSTDDFKFLNADRLIQAQKFHERNQDLSLLVTVAIYILNIVDANVDAHLMQFNVNGKLTLKPEMYPIDVATSQSIGFKLNYSF